MHLYNLSLKKSTAIVHSVLGNFSGGKGQEILVATTDSLELFSVCAETGKLQSMVARQTFSHIRGLVPFRVPGSSKGTLLHFLLLYLILIDYIVVTSDGGRIVVLSFDTATHSFTKVHQETFGKTGLRRIVAGQFLTADPKGRAVMLAAPEKQKLVYILNRDSKGGLMIYSPLEANRSNSVTLALAGVDVGFENPIFAAIEIDYESKEKHLVYYELDLGLNHVVRKWNSSVKQTANHLIALPGGTDGPSGVLVCSENEITWMHQNRPSVRIPIPRRPASHRRNPGVMVTTSAVHKLKKGFFVFLQTEEGDIFKITVDFTPLNPDGSGENAVQEMRIRYLDTTSVCVALNVLKSGFLWGAAECGDRLVSSLLLQLIC